MPLWLLKYLPHLVALAALAFGVWWIQDWGYDRGLAKGEARLEAVLARQAQVAARARTLALEAVRREAATALASAEKARQAASNEATSYRRRLEQALASDPPCAEWSRSPVKCPLPQVSK